MRGSTDQAKGIITFFLLHNTYSENGNFDLLNRPLAPSLTLSQERVWLLYNATVCAASWGADSANI